MKETPSPVCPVVWPCSRAGHLDSAPGKEPAKRVSWGHWDDTGPRRGAVFSAGPQSSLSPSRWPHRLLALLKERPRHHMGMWCPLADTSGLRGGWEDTLLLSIIFREAHALVPHPVWGCHSLHPLLSPPCFTSFTPLYGYSSCVVAGAE